MRCFGLDIQFKNRKLEKLCLNSKEADKTLGPNSGKKLRTRLAEIEAANCVAELLTGRPHPLTGSRVGEFAVDLAGGCRLVFEPCDDPIPEKEDGGIDWKEVKDIRVIFIGDYHE